MESIKIEVIGNLAKIIERPTRITAGTVGLPVEFTFDSQWDGLTKMAIFRAGCVSIIVDKVTDSTTVPWEVLEKPNVRLRIGFFGVNEDGTVAVPTIWANVSVIQDGADPSGEPGGDPTLPIWNQLENDIEDLDNKIEERFQNIETDSLLFEQSGGEGISMECESPAVLKFTDTADDNHVILRGIAPAEEDGDAVNLAQLNDAISGVSGGGGTGGGATVDEVIKELASTVIPSLLVEGMDAERLTIAQDGGEGICMVSEDTRILRFEDTAEGDWVILRGLANAVYDEDAVNKWQLDNAVGDIESALDHIIEIQNSLIGGEA